MGKKTTKRKTRPKKLATIRHDQKRTNILTDELRDFVSEDAQEPTKVRYPRNLDGSFLSTRISRHASKKCETRS